MLAGVVIENERTVRKLRGVRGGPVRRMVGGGDGELERAGEGLLLAVEVDGLVERWALRFGFAKGDGHIALGV